MHTHKQTHKSACEKNGPRHFSSAPFQRQLSFYYIFLHLVIYTSYGRGGLNSCQRHDALWQDQDQNCSSFMSSAVFFFPLFLRLISLTVRLITRASGIISESPCNHFFAVPSRIIRTSGLRMED